MTKPKQALLIGHGGVDMQNVTIDLYGLTLAGKENPTVLFLPQASLENHGYIEHFHQVFGQYPCEARHLVTSDLPTSDLEDYVMQADILYAGAGNTKIGLALWREFGLDKIFRKAYEAGIVWMGGSAGAASAYEASITDSFGPLSIEKCLGFVPHSSCAHYSSSHRRKTFKSAVYNGKVNAGYGVDEGAAVHFVDGSLLRPVSNLIGAKAFYVARDGDKLEHTRLDTIFLNEKETADELIWSTAAFEKATRRSREQRKRERQLEENSLLLTEGV